MATRLLFFGALREPAGAAERIVDLPQDVTDGADLIDWLAADDETLGAALKAPSVRMCVDQVMTKREADIRGAAEIAFMPPFSGG